MSNAYTPGPWAWDEDGHYLRPVNAEPNNSSVHTILSPEGCYGYAMSNLEATTAEDKANHRLIEAVTDLLDAAQAAEAVLGKQKWLAGSTDPEAIALFKLRAAIAKAIGDEHEL